MSGPKAYRLLVLAASELARRELMQTRARGLALRDRLRGQLAVLAGPPAVAVPPEPASDSIQDFQAWEAALQAANRQAEALIADQRARRRLALAAGSTAPAQFRMPPPAGRTAQASQASAFTAIPSPDAVPAPPDAPSAEHAVRVSRALELASELEDQAAFEALAARAAPLAAARPGVVGEADLLVFEAAVADQLKADSNRKALRAEANRQALRIAHLATREAEELRQAVARADTPAAVEAVRRQADQLLDQEARQADADYASHCVAEVLTELGYAVEAGPDAIGQAALAPDARHVMLARRPDLPGHALRLQVTDQGKLFSRVTAVKPASPEQDRAAEELTCADVLTLPAALEKHGIEAELSFARLPGEVKVARAGAAGGSSAGAAGAAATPQSANAANAANTANTANTAGKQARGSAARRTASGGDKDEERTFGADDG